MSQGEGTNVKPQEPTQTSFAGPANDPVKDTFGSIGQPQGLPPTHEAPPVLPPTQPLSGMSGMPSVAPHVDVAQAAHEAANKVMQEAHPQLKPEQTTSEQTPEKKEPLVLRKHEQAPWDKIAQGLGGSDAADQYILARRARMGETNMPAPGSAEYNKLIIQGNKIKAKSSADAEKEYTDAIANGDQDTVTKHLGREAKYEDGKWSITDNRSGRQIGIGADVLKSYVKQAVGMNLQNTSPVELATKGNPKYGTPSYTKAEKPEKPETWTYHKQDDGSYLATNSRNPNDHYTIDTSVEGTTYRNYGGTLYKQTVKGKNVTGMVKAPDEMQPDHNVVTSGTVDGKTVKLLVCYGNNGNVKSKTQLDDGKSLPPDKEVPVLDADGKPAWYDPKTHKTRPTDGEVTGQHKKLMQNKSGNKIIDGEETLNHGGATFPDPGHPSLPAKIPVSIITTVDEKGNTIKVRQVGEEGKKALNDLGAEYVKQKDAMSRQLAAETDPPKKAKIQEAVDYWDKAATRLKQMTDSMNVNDQNKKDENGRYQVTSDKDFNALPSGAEFTGPDGVPRRKP
jgi:hypothetical protein